MTAKTVQFNNQEGQKLSGRLILPMNGEPKAFALFAHCFTCTKNLSATRNIARAMSGAGIATLIFDFTGLGTSEGEFADTNFSSNVGDLIAAAEFLEREYEAPKIIAGHSLGGTAVLKAADKLASVAAVVSIGSPAEPAHVAHLVTSKRSEIEEHGRAEVTLGGRPFSIKRQFLQDIEQQSVLDIVAHFRKALLVMHAPFDETVEIENANKIFLAAKHPKSFVSLDHADHLLTRKEDSEYVGQLIASWASRYIDVPEEENHFEEKVEHGAVARTRIDGFKTHVNAGGHALIADEPISVGGTNLGPGPFDLLSSALATCTTMTLKMYAAHKKIDLISATCHVQHSKKVVGEEKIEHFERKLSLEGNLTKQQRERMIQISDRCPVHRALNNTVEIETSLKVDA